MTDACETSYLNFSWEFSIHETAAVHLYCCWHTDSTELFHTDNAPLQQSSIQRGCMDSGQDCKFCLPGVSCWAADISGNPPPPLPSATESLNNKPSKQTLQNNSVIHLLHKNAMKYIDLMNTHSLTGKLKVHTARVWHSCSKPVVCRRGKTSEEKYIPCWFCTAAPQVFNTDLEGSNTVIYNPLCNASENSRFSTTSRCWVFWRI